MGINGKPNPHYFVPIEISFTLFQCQRHKQLNRKNETKITKPLSGTNYSPKIVFSPCNFAQIVITKSILSKLQPLVQFLGLTSQILGQQFNCFELDVRVLGMASWGVLIFPCGRGKDFIFHLSTNAN
jgi:hypothetical protein